MKQGIHEITADMYHGDCVSHSASLSSSIIKIMDRQTMAHAWAAHPRLNPNWTPDEFKKEFNLGSAVHALLLEGGKGIEVINPENYVSKNGSVPEGYTNPAIREARDMAYHAGKVPLLPWQLTEVQAIANAVTEQLDTHTEMRGWLTEGKSEQTLLWHEPDYNVWCRARLDRVPADPDGIWGDLKTTGTTANPEVLGRFAADQGWDIQEAFYRRGIRALGLCDKPQFRFVCVESYAPYCVSVVGIPPEIQAFADHKIEWALAKWSECLATNKWPGYPQQTCFVEFPPWHFSRFQERLAREDAFK